jgi:hypothetical protein
MNQESKKVKAIDLMMVDLHTRHSEIRNEAKQFHCEDELDKIKQKLLHLLMNERELLQVR